MSLKSHQDAWAWWGARRFRYNVALMVAGAVAFILYLVALAVHCSETPGVEVTLFTTALQGVGYLVAMGVANLCYNIGPALERRLRGNDVAAYRRVAFRAGLWFSVTLPLIIPAMIWARGCQRATP